MSDVMKTPAKILTIEDEPPIRSGIVTYLEDSGFTMLEANDGPSGLEIFRQEHPDVVLCDLRLPGMDGLEVLSTITAESPETPVIVVSGVSLLVYAVQALKRGAWDYVTKPIHDMAVLESAVRRVLEHADLLRQNREYRENLEQLNLELTETMGQLQEDEEAGRKIQFQLLPGNNLCFGEYTFRRQLYPSMYLSGDFINYFLIDDRHVGFYMADVSGHGAASAFVTVMLNTLMIQYRDALWQSGDDRILNPQQIMERLNQDISCQNLDKHLTLFYGVLDLQAHTLQYSNGGQFPYPLLYDGNEMRTLACPGRPIGLFDDAEFESWQCDLPEKCILILVSDGILELMPEDDMLKRYGTLFSENQGAAEMLDNMTAGLDVLADKHLPDDIAFLMISRGHDDG
ncbi:MAG: SpoIIE family protein phosphatase [Gammaproteobacteria bacterium]|nr:SpoIIE family protein phosphatase [Gammaproteobacteria bacterium]